MDLSERKDLLVAEIRALTEVVEREGVMLNGRPHPALVERKRALSELRRTEVAIRLAAEEEESRLRNVPLHLRKASG